MEIPFGKSTISCLRTVLHRVQDQELTQELRIPEGMPEAGKIVCAKGQPVIRSKQWSSDGLRVSGGVMAWILYMPEEEGKLQCLETWLPFQLKWELDSPQPDGEICALPYISGMDARAVASGRLILRVSLSVLLNAVTEDEAAVYKPPLELPEDVQLLQDTYPMLLPVEAGEKSFLTEESVEMPESASALDQMLSYRIVPTVTEQKVVGDKLVFRGVARLEILYLSEDGKLRQWSFEMPFSQYAELNRDFGTEASSVVLPAVMSLEASVQEDGTLSWKAGILGQYILYERENVQLVTDAYSPVRDVQAERTGLQLPSILDMQNERIRLEQVVPMEGGEAVDAWLLQGHPVPEKQASGFSVSVKGQVHAVGHDKNTVPVGASADWEHVCKLAADERCDVSAYVMPSSCLQGMMNADGVLVTGDLHMLTVTTAKQPLPMVTTLAVGDEKPPDPEKPSLILRRAEGDSLWRIAKETGSTVDMIKAANGLQQEPEPMQMLLIPVL